MSFESLLIHTVVIHNPTVSSTSNRYGDEVLEFDAGTPTQGRVQEVGSTEQLSGGSVRVSTLTLFLPANTPISALALIDWNGRQFRVRGEPIRQDDMDGPHHIEAALEIVEGP